MTHNKATICYLVNQHKDSMPYNKAISQENKNKKRFKKVFIPQSLPASQASRLHREARRLEYEAACRDKKIPEPERLILFLRSKNTPIYHKILQRLVEGKLTYEYIFYNQRKWADDLDVTRCHLNKVLHELEKEGFIKIYNRGYQTCLYFLNKVFFGKDRLKLADLFPTLKTLTILLLMSVTFASRSQNHTQNSNFKDSNKRKYKYTCESVSYGLSLAQDFQKKTRREIVKQIASPTINKIALRWGWTDYAKLLFTCFPEYTLLQALQDYAAHKEAIRCPVTWLWKRCATICKYRNITPEYATMNKLVYAAGFRPGDRLTFSSPPRYTKENHTQHQQREACTPPPAAPAPLPPVKRVSHVVKRSRHNAPHAKASEWAALFPVPERIQKEEY